jgi:DNA processing protein
MAETRMWMQRELGRFLRAGGAAVVSGGARGVDQWAHRLCMDEGLPTLCVLPSGLLNPYPPGNQEFWERVVEGGGALLSTFPLREPMRKHHFHTRNRWIVGFSPAVFVVEANRRSGSAMTAGLAREEGREVCTLPVFPHSEQGLGNLDLIGGGATMVRDHEDLAVLWDRCRSSPAFFEGMNREGEEDGVDQP